MRRQTPPPSKAPRSASYATWLLSSTSAILLISPTKATHHWASAVQGAPVTLVGRGGCSTGHNENDKLCLIAEKIHHGVLFQCSVSVRVQKDEVDTQAPLSLSETEERLCKEGTAQPILKSHLFHLIRLNGDVF